MCFESLRPMFWNVLPPSVVFQTPLPHDVLWRLFDSPVPTQSRSGFDCDTVTSPIDISPWSSKIGVKIAPLLVVFQTPPCAVPDIPDRRILFVHGDIGDAARHDGRSDGPEMQLLELLGDGPARLREQRWRGEKREQCCGSGAEARRDVHTILRGRGLGGSDHTAPVGPWRVVGEARDPAVDTWSYRCRRTLARSSDISPDRICGCGRIVYDHAAAGAAAPRRVSRRSIAEATPGIAQTLPGERATSEGQARSSRKRVEGKEDPVTLIAVDHSSCTVTAEKFKDTKIGDTVACDWSPGVVRRP